MREREKVWLDPNEVNKISMANFKQNIRKLVKDGFVKRKPTKIHTQSHAHRMKEAKRKGHHQYNYIKRKGITKATLHWQDLVKENGVMKLWTSNVEDFLILYLSLIVAFYLLILNN